ncbi:MAG TPA: polyhydroxyalkanoate synthesis protein PhaF [Actinomycetes bacterium]
MVLDGLRGYIQLANGLTDVTRARALATARALVAQGEAGVGAVVPAPVRSQVGTITEDLLATSKANRDLLVNLVRAEVERSVARLGLVSAQELQASTRRSRSLERRVEELEQDLRRARATGGKKATAKKPATKKTTAKKTTAKKTATKKTATKKTTAKKSATTTAKKATATTSAAGSSA